MAEQSSVFLALKQSSVDLNGDKWGVELVSHGDPGCWWLCNLQGCPDLIPSADGKELGGPRVVNFHQPGLKLEHKLSTYIPLIDTKSQDLA